MGKVQTVGILFRRTRYLVIRVLTRIASMYGRQTPAENHRSILLYPVPDAQRGVGDLLNRLACALHDEDRPQPLVRLPVGDIADGVEFRKIRAPDFQADYLTRFLAHVKIETCPDEDLEKAAKQADYILLWRASSLFDPVVIRNLGKVLIVDPDYYLAHEPYNYAQLPYLMLSDSERQSAREVSIGRFRDLYARHHGADTAYVLVTGPSLTEAIERPLEANAVKIICNSIVKDTDLLETIQPDILVFADPVFHFGPSKYADEFRRYALATLQHFPQCYCVVPEIFAPFLMGHMPEVACRIIGMPQARIGAINFPTPERCYARITDNIMTFLMLPIAATLSHKIVVIGADGRQKSESYYWKHNPKVQFADLMETAFETHPSFIRDRVLADYYDKHCKMVARILDKAVSELGSSIYTRTPSFIPALSKRHEVVRGE